ncbi:hypothetical protein P4S68_23430 [Pseudoalteromonas sp. Hal099]
MMSKVLLHTLATIVMTAFLVTNAQASTEGIAAAPETSITIITWLKRA